jgi:histo-blood group ABO system transferase
MKIGILIIATNKYVKFLENLIKSCDQYLLLNYEVEYFIFTNHSSISVKSERKINLINVDHKPWPWMTLGRYKIFSENQEILKQMNYLYYFDADMILCDTVDEEILDDRVVTVHPGFLGGRGTPETNPQSLACVSPHEPMIYFAGGFNGGKSDIYLDMAKALSNNIDQDYKNGIIAIWHDESHFNRYTIDNKPTKILSPSYCYQENSSIPFKAKIIALDKKHEEMRSE